MVDGILIDEDLTSAEMASLIACCDTYVSLHRAEGFGLGMAEAMYLGRPVIATNYSGNRDFATATTSFPVGYRLREVELGELRYNPGVEAVYEPGMLWAEPDVIGAAHWMRHVFESSVSCQATGRRGQTRIHEDYGSASAARAMRKRLGELAQQLGSR
jgi:hypothetical protein